MDARSGSSPESLAKMPARPEHDPKYVVGQYVELITTVPSSGEGSVQSGTRAVIQAVDVTGPDDRIYLVAFLSSERTTGETAWIREIDLLPS